MQRRRPCHVCLLEEVEREVAGGSNDLVAGFPAEKRTDFREEIERAGGLVHLQAENPAGQFNHQVAAALKSLTHLLDALLQTGICSLGGFLRN